MVCGTDPMFLTVMVISTNWPCAVLFTYWLPTCALVSTLVTTNSNLPSRTGSPTLAFPFGAGFVVASGDAGVVQLTIARAGGLSSPERMASWTRPIPQHSTTTTPMPPSTAHNVRWERFVGAGAPVGWD